MGVGGAAQAVCDLAVVVHLAGVVVLFSLHRALEAFGPAASAIHGIAQDAYEHIAAPAPRASWRAHAARGQFTRQASGAGSVIGGDACEEFTQNGRWDGVLAVAVIGLRAVRFRSPPVAERRTSTATSRQTCSEPALAPWRRALHNAVALHLAKLVRDGEIKPPLPVRGEPAVWGQVGEAKLCAKLFRRADGQVAAGFGPRHALKLTCDYHIHFAPLCELQHGIEHRALDVEVAGLALFAVTVGVGDERPAHARNELSALFDLRLYILVHAGNKRSCARLRGARAGLAGEDYSADSRGDALINWDKRGTAGFGGHGQVLSSCNSIQSNIIIAHAAAKHK